MTPTRVKIERRRSIKPGLSRLVDFVEARAPHDAMLKTLMDAMPHSSRRFPKEWDAFLQSPQVDIDRLSVELEFDDAPRLDLASAQIVRLTQGDRPIMDLSWLANGNYQMSYDGYIDVKLRSLLATVHTTTEETKGSNIIRLLSTEGSDSERYTEWVRDLPAEELGCLSPMIIWAARHDLSSGRPKPTLPRIGRRLVKRKTVNSALHYSHELLAQSHIHVMDQSTGRPLRLPIEVDLGFDATNNRSNAEILRRYLHRELKLSHGNRSIQTPVSTFSSQS